MPVRPRIPRRISRAVPVVALVLLVSFVDAGGVSAQNDLGSIRSEMEESSLRLGEMGMGLFRVTMQVPSLQSHVSLVTGLIQSVQTDLDYLEAMIQLFGLARDPGTAATVVLRELAGAREPHAAGCLRTAREVGGQSHLHTAHHSSHGTGTSRRTRPGSPAVLAHIRSARPGPQMTRWGGSVTVLLATLGAACADSPVEPDTPFAISFSHSVISKGWNLETFRHECVYSVSGQASGGAFAVWDSGDLELRYTNGSIDTSNLQAVNILDYWGSGQIKTGSLLEASRIAWGASSFELVHTFIYWDWKGQSTSQMVFIDCTVPPPTGSIAGTVTIDGVAAEGLTVTLSSGEAATTGAAGGYTISGAPLGAYRVTISGQPGDVVFPTVAQVAVIVTPDQVVSVNFGGIRIPASAIIHSVTSGRLWTSGGQGDPRGCREASFSCRRHERVHRCSLQAAERFGSCCRGDPSRCSASGMERRYASRDGVAAPKDPSHLLGGRSRSLSGGEP